MKQSEMLMCVFFLRLKIEFQEQRKSLIFKAQN